MMPFKQEEKRFGPLRLLPVLLVLTFLFTGACRHARIQLAPPLPAVCKSEIANPILCESAKETQTKQIAGRKKTVKTFKHYFIWWGFYPKKKEYSAAKICPNGVYEVYEHSTWKDGMYAELTLGFLLRRTMRVTCY